MSHSEQEPQAGQGGGTGGLTGTELGRADETIERPDLDPDAWDAKPADEESHPPRSAPDARGAAGEDEGSTAGDPPAGPR